MKQVDIFPSFAYPYRDRQLLHRWGIKHWGVAQLNLFGF